MDSRLQLVPEDAEACRSRMEAALRQSDQDRARIQRAAERFAHQVEDDEANAAADRADPARWRPGWPVRMKGLVQRPDHNGSSATLQGYDRERSRWRVLFPDGTFGNLRQGNLDLDLPGHAPAPEPRTGPPLRADDTEETPSPPDQPEAVPRRTGEQVVRPDPPDDDDDEPLFAKRVRLT